MLTVNFLVFRDSAVASIVKNEVEVQIAERTSE